MMSLQKFNEYNFLYKETFLITEKKNIVEFISAFKIFWCLGKCSFIVVIQVKDLIMAKK